MLYGLEANPASKTDLIQAIRKRGLGFTLTRGLRSLTISKSRNDAELRRTLEEADRRRQNPTAAKLPSEAEAKKLIDNARQNTLAAVEEMPDFVVKQRIKRSYAHAGTGNFRSLDRLIVAVSYLSKGQEEYKVLSINGVIQEKPKSKSDYSEVKGTSSTGEFVSVLAKIFKRDSDTKFELVDTDTIRGRRSVVFNYSIEKDKAKQLLTSQGYTTDSTITGVKGRIWIDRENFRVLRVENIATEIPVDFPIRSAQRIINYDWVKINEEMYLLPSLSDVRLTFRQSRNLFESRNLIHFKDYKKYGSEVIILDDDDEDIVDDSLEKPAPETKPEP
ncbi:MAG: hypothetical protein HKN25_00545, partial [Pyrinomonadaceae bacterium]|nr:hypothetical protein [Pyrinomonadaceae bacterium]